MSVIAKPYTFSANTTISSSQVNSNFDTLYNDYNGGISAANLADSAVSTAKIADSAVTTSKINDSAVTTSKINDSAVTTSKINDSAITTNKVGNDAITDTKLIFGKIMGRQGGDASNWATTAGTTNYDTSGSNVMIQTGFSTSSSGGAVSVTFPNAYTNTPLVMGSQQLNTTTRGFFSVDSTSNTSFAFSLINTSSARINNETVAWIAIGI